MARAAAKPITWILLSEAKARVDKLYQSREFAERRLRQWLLAGKLPWRSEYFEGSKLNSDPGSGDPEFWRYPGSSDPEAWNDRTATFNFGGRTPTISIRPNMVITWEESCARRGSYSFYRIEVSEDDLTKLMPAGDAEGDEASAKAWVTAEAKRMKTAGEIPGGITKKADFAKLLEGQIKAAARRGDAVKPVGYRHIANNLKDWGLWPISSI